MTTTTSRPGTPKRHAPATAVPGRFRAMDASTKDEWMVIAAETLEHQGRVADSVLSMLRSLTTIVDGFAVDQLTHSLQTATRAEEAGADTEWIVASLCHDIGKAVSVANHPKIAAEILRPYVRAEIAEVIAAHQDFQGKHYYDHLNLDPDARRRYEGEPWYELAARFADEWDQTSFDAAYPTMSLEHFEPMVREVFASPKSL